MILVVLMPVMIQTSERKKEGKKEGNVLFNDVLNTFYLQLYGIRHMVMDHSDRKRRNLLPLLHGLPFTINSNVFVFCTITQTG